MEKKDEKKKPKVDPRAALPKGPVMMEVIANDRLGQKVRIKCLPEDTVGDLKKLISAHTGTKPEKIRLQKGYVVFKDHITLNDYEIKDGTGLEMYYN